MSNILIMHMRREEAKVEDEDSTDTETAGLRRSAIINWYLEECEKEIETENELLEKKALIEKVLNRLTYHDQVIIPLSQSGLKDAGESIEEDPLLVVHPNYIIE